VGNVGAFCFLRKLGIEDGRKSLGVRAMGDPSLSQLLSPHKKKGTKKIKRENYGYPPKTTSSLSRSFLNYQLLNYPS
jgi:hypothetical protein